MANIHVDVRKHICCHRGERWRWWRTKYKIYLIAFVSVSRAVALSKVFTVSHANVVLDLNVLDIHNTTYYYIARKLILRVYSPCLFVYTQNHMRHACTIFACVCLRAFVSVIFKSNHNTRGDHNVRRTFNVFTFPGVHNIMRSLHVYFKHTRAQHALNCRHSAHTVQLSISHIKHPEARTLNRIFSDSGCTRAHAPTKPSRISTVIYTHLSYTRILYTRFFLHITTVFLCCRACVFDCRSKMNKKNTHRQTLIAGNTTTQRTTTDCDCAAACVSPRFPQLIYSHSLYVFFFFSSFQMCALCDTKSTICGQRTRTQRERVFCARDLCTLCVAYSWVLSAEPKRLSGVYMNYETQWAGKSRTRGGGSSSRLFRQMNSEDVDDNDGDVNAADDSTTSTTTMTTPTRVRPVRGKCARTTVHTRETLLRDRVSPSTGLVWFHSAQRARAFSDGSAGVRMKIHMHHTSIRAADMGNIPCFGMRRWERCERWGNRIGIAIFTVPLIRLVCAYDRQARCVAFNAMNSIYDNCWFQLHSEFSCETLVKCNYAFSFRGRFSLISDKFIYKHVQFCFM